jgi:O-antigen/teichoic acid export membrane protein
VSYAKKAFNGIVLVFAINVLAAGFGYLARIVLARNLTLEEYGLFFSIFALINAISIFNSFGMGEVLVKFIPDFLVKKDPSAVRKTVNMAVNTQVVLNLITGGLLFLCAGWLAEVLFKTPTAKVIIWMFIPIMLLGNLRGLLRSAYQSFQKIKLFMGVYLFENIFILLFLLIAFSFEKSMFSATIAHIILYLIIVLGFGAWFYKKTLPADGEEKEHPSLKKDMLKFGLPVMISGIGGMMMLYLDTLMLTYFDTLTQVGIYNVIVPTVMILLFFGKSVSSVIQPMIAEMHAKNEKEIIANTLGQIEKYTFIGIVPLAVLMMSFSYIILDILFGPEFTSGGPSMFILAASMIPLALYTVHASFFSSLGKPAIATKILVAAGILNFVLNLFLIPWLSIVGASIASLIAYALCAVLSTIYLRKEIDRPINHSGMLRTLMSGIIMYLVLMLAFNFWKIDTILNMMVTSIFAGMVYLADLLLSKSINIKEIKELLRKKQ